MDSDRGLDGNQAVSHQEGQASHELDLESTTSSEHSTAEFAPINNEPLSDPDNTDATKQEYERRPTEDDLERGLPTGAVVLPAMKMTVRNGRRYASWSPGCLVMRERHTPRKRKRDM